MIEPLEARRLLDAGGLDTTFDFDGRVITAFSGGADQIDGLAVQPDGNIVAAGSALGDFAVARYTTSGALDSAFDGDGMVTTPFGAAGTAKATGVVIDPSTGDIIVVGYSFTSGLTSFDFNIARYDSNGSLDLGFGGGTGKVTTNFASTSTDLALAVALDSSGNILVAGTSNGDFALAKYTSAGVLDGLFGVGGKVTTDIGAATSDQASAIVVQPDGKIVLGGTSANDFALARYNSDGSLDTAGFGGGTGKVTTDMGAGSVDVGTALARQSTGELVLAGTSDNDFAVARYDSSGVLDTSLDGDGKLTTDIGAGTTDVATGVAISSSGKIIVAGTSNGDFAVARYATGGALDTSFDTDGKVTTDISGVDSGLALAIGIDEKIIVAGSANAGADFALARYDVELPNDVWVNDTWQITINVGPAGLSFGDIVANDAGAGDDVTVTGKVYGFNAFSTIASSLPFVGTGGTVHVLAGLYNESNVSLDQAMIIDGTSLTRANVVVGPAIADSHDDSSFGGTVSNAFVIRSSDVTIRDLTIDGDQDGLLPGDQNFRQAVITDFSLGVYSNLVVDNIQAQNIYRKGVNLVATGTNYATGLQITDSGFDHIGTSAALGFEGYFAITVFQGTALIDHNTITNSGGGIGSNYFNSESEAPLLTVTNNSFTAALTLGTNPVVGLDLSGLADGSLASGNTIDVSGAGGTSQDIAIVIQYAAAGADVVVQSNPITTGTGDTGIYLYQNDDSAHPVLIDNNPMTGSGSAIGILVSDNGAVFGESPHSGTTYATLTRNDISGFATAIKIESASANVATATIGGGPLDSNTVVGAASGTGILVEGANASATITNNGSSISGFAIGIDVNGGSATISGNLIYDNGTGIRFVNGGSGSVDGNDFDDATDNATDLLLDSTAGAVTIGAGNQFAGDTFFIDDQTTQSYDLSANATTFDETNNFRIEDKMHHRLDTDLPVTNGLVTWVAGNLYVTDAGTDHSIQRGVNSASAGDIVNVEAGNYVENVVVDEEVEIVGAGQGATVVMPAAADPQVNSETVTGSLSGTPSNVFLVEADNVEIHDLTVDGDNPLLLSGITRGAIPADVDARNGIITNHTLGVFDNLSVHDVTVKNIYLRGIYASSGGTFDFDHNTIVNVRGSAASIGMFNFGGSGTMTFNDVSDTNDAIASNWSTGTQYLNNTVTDSDSGIHTDNNGGAGGAGDLIQDNDVSAGSLIGGSYGIWAFAPYVNVLIKDNTISDVDVGLGAFGGFGGTVTFDSNDVNLMSRPGSIGAWISTTLFGFGSANVSAILTNDNSITNADTGIFVEDEDGPSTATATISNNSASIHGNLIGIDVSAGDATISGNSIYNNGTGIQFRDGATGGVSGNDFDNASDNDTDLLLATTAGTVTIGAGNQFAGDTFFIDDQTTQSYDLSANGTTFDEANNFRIEDKMHHRLDTDLLVTNGLVTWVAGNLYVTDAGTDHSIQRGVDAASTGDIVNVEAGNYGENVLVNKRVTVDGAGRGTNPAVDTIVTSVAANTPVFTVTGTGASALDRLVLSDMRITGATGGGGNSQSGVLVGSSGAIGYYTFDNLAVVGNTGYGIAFSQSGGSVNDVDVTNSDLSNNAVGVRFASALTTVTDVLVDDSTFTDNTFNGFIINPDGLASFSADDITITDSTFTNNGDGVSTGAGDVSLFVFNGDATLTNVSITTDSHIGLQIRGGNAPSSRRPESSR